MQLAAALALIVAANVTHQSPSSLVRVDAPDAVITNVGWIIPAEKNSSSNKPEKPKLDPLGTPSPVSGEIPNPLDSTRGGDDWILAPPATRPASSSVVSKPTVYLGVRNTGTKTIKAIDWKVIIFNDRIDGSEYLVLQFRTKKAVPSGKEVLQSHEFPFDQKWKPLRQDIWDAARGLPPGEGRNNRAPVKAVIVGIEYADGSTWQRHE